MRRRLPRVYLYLRFETFLWRVVESGVNRISIEKEIFHYSSIQLQYFVVPENVCPGNN